MDDLTAYRLQVAAKLNSDHSFTYYDSLPYPPDNVFLHIGLYMQGAAAIDLVIRRIYFALLADGDNTTRGKEKATLFQMLDRLPKAIESSPVKLYKKKHFPRLIVIIKGLLSLRNQVAHSSCRWEPRCNMLIFAHANEKVGASIRTGDGIVYWSIDMDKFIKVVKDLKKMGGFMMQYSATWLPKLRPWLPTYFNGKPDVTGDAAERFFTDYLERNGIIDMDEIDAAIDEITAARVTK
ncbi:hypothetical protein U1707_08950 [Sphingomonas sp. PB2P12]|uniref:hypothetical protein n=1 Tax=Sphingomonas sandaracina TaxID=3096157 RepID=UPI002FC5FFBC